MLAELLDGELSSELILSFAALFTAIAGVLSAWAALRRTRQRAEDDCLRRLQAIREALR